MKKISRLFPLILCTVSVHAAPQWSCPKCTADQIKPIFEKYATGDALVKMLDTFDKNLNNGVLNARGFARTCHAAGLKGSVGTEGYKKCEAFVLEMADLATPLKTKVGTSSAKMSECEAEVRAELINKGEMSAGSIVDALKKNPPQGCGFDDSDSYLFKGVTVSGGQAMSLAGLLGRKQCRVDQSHGILVCEDKYAYIFDGLDNNDKLTTERANNIAKGVCAIAAKTSANNRDMLSFDDNVKGCPTPQVVANCAEYQKQLRRINPSLVAKEQKEYAQTYCVVSVNKSKPQSEATYTAHLNDFVNQESDIRSAIQLIENSWPQLNCSYYDWYNSESGIYSVKCDEAKAEKKGPSAHGFRFKKLWCFGDEGEYEYDPKIGGCKLAPAKPTAGCTPQNIDSDIFNDVTVMPMQAIAMSTRYINKQCQTNKYDCRGKMPNGNNVNCGDIDLRFGNISNSNQGAKANSSIAKGICKMYGGSYTDFLPDNADYGWCEGISRSVCEGSYKADVQLVAPSVAVKFGEGGACVVNWGPRDGLIH